MRTQPEGPPDATHGGLTQARPRCQRATAPMRCSLGSLFQGEAYGPFDTVIANLPWCSRPHLVAAKLRTTGFTVGLWRNRFITEGMVGLSDEPRPGAPREIGDAKIEQVVR